MTGRNDPCPCGSGIKFKRCHGKPAGSAQPNTLPPPGMSQGMIIKNLLRDEIYSLGGPGMVLGMLVETRGDLTSVLANPDDHMAALNVDLPFLIPIEDGPYDVLLSDRPVLIHHEKRERGSEEFSTLDTTALPYFSFLQIQMKPFADYSVGPPPVGDSFPEKYKSYLIIIEVLEKLDKFLRISSGVRLLDKDSLPRLSYRIGYFRQGEPPTWVAESKYPTSDPIRIRGPEVNPAIDNVALHKYLSQSIRIAEFAKRVIEPEFSGKTFRERALLVLHDFCYYCRQRARAVAQLQEEQIRDLFLVVVKCLFGGGEGEVFHFDGKLDYKINNPENRYEFITGELKWWCGPASAAEIYHQGVRKHATGQEAEIHLIMLNSNKDGRSMAEEYWKCVEAERETKKGSRFYPNLPAGSKERFRGVVVEIRGECIPLIAAVADMYYERT